MRVEVLTTLSEFIAVEAAWTESLLKYPNGSVHLSFPWIRSWWEVFGDTGKMHCMVAWEGSRMIGMAPLIVERRRMGGMRLPVLRLIGNEISPRSDIVLLDRKEEVLAAFIDGMTRIDWICFDLGRIPAGSESLRLLRAHVGREFTSIRLRSAFAVPRVDLGGTWEEYLSGRTPHFRKKVRQSFKKNQEFETWAFPMDFDDIDRLLEHVRRVSQDTWKHEHGTSLASDSRSLRFFDLVARAAHRDGNLFAVATGNNACAVTFAVCIRHASVVYGIKTGYSMSAASASPGFHTMAALIRMALEQRLGRAIDLDCASSHGEYKTRLATASEEVVSCYLFRPTVASSVLERIYAAKKMLDGWRSGAGDRPGKSDPWEE